MIGLQWQHKPHDQKLLKVLDKTIISKVKIGHGEFIQIKVKVNQVVDILTSLKYISDAL